MKTPECLWTLLLRVKNKIHKKNIGSGNGLVHTCIAELQRVNRGCGTADPLLAGLEGTIGKPLYSNMHLPWD